MELLRRGDRDGLERLVASEPRAVQPLVGRLWDGDPEVVRLAAEALGSAAATHMELGEELLRRALWAFNDESAMHGAPMLPMVGEIGRRDPELMARFVGPLTSYLWDETLRPGILRALCRIAETAPDLVAEVRDRLQAIAQDIDPGERADLEHLLAVTRESADGS